jgi:hypothetical protein
MTFMKKRSASAQAAPAFAEPWPTGSGGAASVLKAFRDPHLDYGLAGNAQPTSFTIERFDHPGRKINVDPALFHGRPTDRAEIEIAGNVVAFVKLSVELFSSHRVQPLLCGAAEPK